MSEDSTGTDADTDAPETPDRADVWARDTAPQTPYTMREVGIGLAGLVVGAAIAFGLPLALA